ncbi:MAG: cation transporter [Bacteroidales bacterium]|nr:cation transporter [Bacteroidales bacterium]
MSGLTSRKDSNRMTATKQNHIHGHPADLKEKNLLLATALNLLITITEIIGGLISNSLALLSDAIHNLGDTLAVMIAYIANRISKRSATEKKTFGYKRVEILTALLNTVVLIVIIIFLFIEAYHRLQSPEPIKGLVMFIVATIGLIANLIAVLLLKNDSHSNMNIRSAYLHLLGDTISSVAVIAGSVLIYFFRIYWIDPLITILIGLYIIKEAYVILKEAVDILMQGTPSSLDLQEVVIEIEKHTSVSNVHHVHVWKLNDTQIHFEGHIDLDKDLPVSTTDQIRSEIEEILQNKFGISHVTIQFEYNCCKEKKVIHK